MTKLIINADDYGYCESVNEAIILAHKNGIVSSTTIMAAMPGFEHGIELLKETPTLKTGVHMTLTCGKPLLKGHKTIVNEKGEFFRKLTNEIIENMDEDEIFNEFCAQIDKVVNSGIEITHLDSHHHVHGLEFLKDVIHKIVKKYELPIRDMFVYTLEDLGIKTIPHPVSFYQETVSENFFNNNKEEIFKHDIIDVMCHPAFISEFLLKSTSYSHQRKKEYDVLTSECIKENIKALGMEITNYKDM